MEDDLYEVHPISKDMKYWFYTLKAMNTPCSITIKTQTEELVSKNCNSIGDYGRGMYHYKTSSRWVTSMGILEDGKRFSINFEEGIIHEELSESQIQAFKIDSKLVKLNPIVLKYDELNLMNSFTLKTHENFKDLNRQVDLVFTSHKAHYKVDNFIIIKNKMELVYGTLSGWVSDEEGNKYQLKDVPALFEAFISRW